MNKRNFILFVHGLIISWCIWNIRKLVDGDLYNQLINSDLSIRELQLAVYVLAAAASFMLGIEILRFDSVSHFRSLRNLVERPSAMLAASLVVVPLTPQHSHVVEMNGDALPVESVLSPSIAAAVVRHIVRRRREQIRDSFMPDTFTVEESSSLLNVVSAAGTNRDISEGDILQCQNVDVINVIGALERPMKSEVLENCEIPLYSIVVQLYGYPEVRNRAGDTAVFRKKRALELLTWLTLNRDRSRRSTARTAMWEYDITDATFSTIISDMRRSLTQLDQSVGEVVPPTFTDEIKLHACVVTDYDLLKDALARFRLNQRDYEDVVQFISGIRDVPFAGTSYIWADLDGTTTRLVIQAITACLEVAQWASENSHHDVLQTAISAGLKVFPGHEELVELQGRLHGISNQRNSRSVA